MIHLWVRSEQRLNESRVGLTPEGAAALLRGGIHVTVEESTGRVIPIADYRAAGCEIAPENSWPDAPADSIIFGLKELPQDDTPLRHRHIMFGHAYKGQPDGRVLMERFLSGGGTLYDLEYLVDGAGWRVAAFGYWAGFAGAAVALRCWAAQQHGSLCGPVGSFANKDALMTDLGTELVATGVHRPRALIIGALGRVGSGVADLCAAMGVRSTRWDMAETASGGPFPEVLAHEIFFNCILARPGTPVFVPAATVTQARALRVVGDIACDPDNDFSPIKIYDRTTTWDAPALRVHENPPLDVTAIDNLPSMLPLESSLDYAAQLLPSLLTLTALDAGVWARAKIAFDARATTLTETPT
ncbi:MAG: saccharopine dehydrogenase [Halocynthiibacter sp.]